MKTATYAFHTNRIAAYLTQANETFGKRAELFFDAARAHGKARDAEGTKDYNLLAVAALEAAEAAYKVQS